MLSTRDKLGVNRIPWNIERKIDWANKEEANPTRSPVGKVSNSPSSSVTSAGGSGCGSHCNKGRRARGMYTGAVVSTAARYSTAQGSATAAARRSTAAAPRSADAREGGSGEFPRKRRRDVADWTRIARCGLPIAGRQAGGRAAGGDGHRRGGEGFRRDAEGASPSQCNGRGRRKLTTIRGRAS